MAVRSMCSMHGGFHDLCLTSLDLEVLPCHGCSDTYAVTMTLSDLWDTLLRYYLKYPVTVTVTVTVTK